MTTLFDNDAEKLLDTKASQLCQQGTDTEAPALLRNLCQHKLIFEIKLTDQNLKEGSQNHTVTGLLSQTTFY